MPRLGWASTATTPGSPPSTPRPRSPSPTIPCPSWSQAQARRSRSPLPCRRPRSSIRRICRSSRGNPSQRRPRRTDLGYRYCRSQRGRLRCSSGQGRRAATDLVLGFRSRQGTRYRELGSEPLAQTVLGLKILRLKTVVFHHGKEELVEVLVPVDFTAVVPNDRAGRTGGQPGDHE